jgi:hypothetical protein
MAGYLVAVSYQVNAVTQPTLFFGIDVNIVPDSASAITLSENVITTLVTKRGQIATNMVGIINQTR